MGEFEAKTTVSVYVK